MNAWADAHKTVVCPDGSTIDASYDDSTNTLTVSVTDKNGNTEPDSGGTVVGDGSTARLTGHDKHGNKWGAKVDDGFWSDDMQIYCVGANTNRPWMIGPFLNGPWLAIGGGSPETLVFTVQEGSDFILPLVNALKASIYEITNVAGTTTYATMTPLTASSTTPSAVPGQRGLYESTVTLNFGVLTGVTPNQELAPTTSVSISSILDDDTGYVLAMGPYRIHVQ